MIQEEGEESQNPDFAMNVLYPVKQISESLWYNNLQNEGVWVWGFFSSTHKRVKI